MNMYVWDGVLTDYTSGMIVAHAESLKAARLAVLKECRLNQHTESAYNEVKNTKPTRVFRGSGAAIVHGGG
jgi:hypothetical protein